MPLSVLFTLVETVVSLAIIATGLLLFLHATALSLQLQGRSRRASEALLLAQEVMEALRAEGWESAAASFSDSGARGGQRGQDLSISEIRRGGGIFRLVLERTAVEPGLEHYRVMCCWKDGTGRYRSRNSVRFLGARGTDR